MSSYHRTYIKGGCYFFTLVTWKRTPIFNKPEHIDLLRRSFTKVQQTRPFHIDAIVILPNHLHCILRLPEGDSDYSSRWKEIKKYVSKRISKKHNKNNENLIWQRRFWEHLIRDENDWKRHMDYIHYNPVKHDYVNKPSLWKASSFLNCVEKGWYDKNWGQDISDTIKNMNLE